MKTKVRLVLLVIIFSLFAASVGVNGPLIRSNSSVQADMLIPDIDKKKNGACDGMLYCWWIICICGDVN